MCVYLQSNVYCCCTYVHASIIHVRTVNSSVKKRKKERESAGRYSLQYYYYHYYYCHHGVHQRTCPKVRHSKLPAVAYSCHHHHHRWEYRVFTAVQKKSDKSRKHTHFFSSILSSAAFILPSACGKERPWCSRKERRLVAYRLDVGIECCCYFLCVTIRTHACTRW